MTKISEVGVANSKQKCISFGLIMCQRGGASNVDLYFLTIKAK